MEYEVMKRLVYIGHEKARPPDERGMRLAQCLSVFHEDLLVGWNEMGMKQVRLVLQMQTAIGMVFYFKKAEAVHHIFHSLFVKYKLSAVIVTWTSYEQKILE